MRTLLTSAASGSLALLVCGCAPQTDPPAAPSDVPTIPKPSTTPTAQSFDTPEYQSSTSAKNSNAIEAWEQGATGKGIKIGFVDTGLYTTNPDFVGRIDPASRDVVSDRQMWDDYGHGTALASIAAGAQNGTLIEGVAYDATIVMMRVDKPGSCTPSCDFVDVDKGITAAAKAGARVINLSIGGSVDGDIVDAVKHAAQSGVIFVVSAGNDSGSEPSDFAKAIAAAAPGQVIIAGALGRGTSGSIDYNQLWSQSNKAGSFLNWYLGAPGYMINAASKNSYDQFSGTSFAAPAVAGAIALLLQAFPSLSPKDIVQILLSSADDLGAAGNDNTFGHGRMDIGRAFQPIGATALAGSAVPVSVVDNGSAPAAAGDAMDRGSLKAIVLDAYSRAFAVNLARTLKPAAAARPLEQALSGDLRTSYSLLGGLGVSLALNDDFDRKTGLVSPSVGPRYAADLHPRLLSLVSNPGRNSSLAFSINGGAIALERTLNGDLARGFLINSDVLGSPGFASRPAKSGAARHDFGFASVTASRETGEVQRSYIGDSEANYRINRIGVEKRVARAQVALSLANIKENKTVLGGRLDSLFGGHGANSVFLDGSVIEQLSDGWSLNVAARRGWTRFGGERLTTSAYAASVAKTDVWQSGDEFTLSISQPLRIEAGGISMTLPGSYSYSTRSATYDRSYLSLSPSGREIVSELGYMRRLSRGFGGLSFYVRREPGHSRGVAPDIGGAMQLRLKL